MTPHTSACDCPNCDSQGRGKYPLLGLIILAVPAALFLIFLVN